jgi:hypothetical protein
MIEANADFYIPRQGCGDQRIELSRPARSGFLDQYVPASLYRPQSQWREECMRRRHDHRIAVIEEFVDLATFPECRVRLAKRFNFPEILVEACRSRASRQRYGATRRHEPAAEEPDPDRHAASRR